MSPNSGLTDAEKSMIFRATRRHGSWFLCSRGHPYLVTECGTPVMVASCPECGCTIGGKNHRFAAETRTGKAFFDTKGVV